MKKVAKKGRKDETFYRTWHERMDCFEKDSLEVTFKDSRYGLNVSKHGKEKLSCELCICAKNGSSLG